MGNTQQQIEDFWKKQVNSSLEAQKSVVTYIQANILTGTDKSISQSLTQIRILLDNGVKGGVLKKDWADKLFSVYEQNLNLTSNLIKNSQESFINSIENMSDPKNLTIDKMATQFNEYFLSNTKMLSDLYNQQLSVAKDLFNPIASEKNNVEDAQVVKETKKRK